MQHLAVRRCGCRCSQALRLDGIASSRLLISVRDGGGLVSRRGFARVERVSLIRFSQRLSSGAFAPSHASLLPVILDDTQRARGGSALLRPVAHWHAAAASCVEPTQVSSRRCIAPTPERVDGMRPVRLLHNDQRDNLRVCAAAPKSAKGDTARPATTDKVHWTRTNVISGG